MTDPLADLERHVAERAEARLADLVELLRIPSISTLPEHGPDLRRTADFLAERMVSMGLEHVEVISTPGHPIVYGDWLHAPGAPTVIVYGHYDVQPVDPLELWVKPPFDPRIEDGRVYARGSADDKGQVHLHLQAAEAWLAVRGGFPINLRYLFEGEEEYGSESIEAWLATEGDRLTADLCVISDTDFFAGNVPQLTVGLRGIAYLQVDVRGPRQDLHSGHYGGAVRNPADALASILAALHDAEGRVAVPGFYDDVRPLSEAERAEGRRLPFDPAAFAAEMGVSDMPGEAGYSVIERIGARPTLDVNGLWGGFQGEGAKTIIPAEAHAKLSCRLVPDQDPERIADLVSRRIRDLAPSGVEVNVSFIHGGRPVVTAIDGPAAIAASRSLEATFGTAPLFSREGGSIPVAALFARLGLPVVLLGFANPDAQAHAPNESLILANYEGGIRTVIRYWDELSRTRFD
jgi:acetylornithine deacetylase/succinyl-diaminopimelate desuccinylase-like protein